MISTAFLQLRTLEDLLTVCDLLERRVHVAFEPQVGSLFGPPAPSDLHFASVRAHGIGVRRLNRGPVKRATNVFGFAATSVRDYLETVLTNRKRYSWMEVECDPDLHPIIREIHLDVLNLTADLPMSRVATTKLVRFLARHFGATVEPQMPYGDPEWAAFTKGRLGTLVSWCRPGRRDLVEMLEADVPGLVNASRARAIWPHFQGIADGHYMPDKGVLRTTDYGDPEGSHDMTGEPTGLGPAWDRVNDYYRLLGYRMDADATVHEKKVAVFGAHRYATKLGGARPRDRVTVVVSGSVADAGNLFEASQIDFEIADIQATADWIETYWDGIVGLNFTRPADRPSGAPSST